MSWVGFAGMDPNWFGRSGRIRTCDPLVPNEVRYQTAPHSDIRVWKTLKSRGVIAADRQPGKGYSDA